ncbi:alpha/beta fold hydrolase [Amycolatopsis orientalis]|uniref:alpha/beta fold hydrolase n=1 Tax=Amycolatopsis orientalis TaxID=31958 RepID=UPI00039CC3CA|nr:alpha/beta hydrolase [Amycolatopsis orientalis]
MKLHTKVYGRGERTAVLIHGGTVDSGVWHAVAPRVAALGYTVLAPDLRGHGRSPRGRYSPEDWADDLVETLPAGADVVLGHSLGATVLGQAVDRLRPRRAVFAEPGFEHDVKPPEYFAQRRTLLAQTTVDSVRAAHPSWTEKDAAAVAAAAARCDPAVLDAVAGLSRDRVSLIPDQAVAPSLLLVAGQGSVVRPATAQLLAGRGFEVAVLAEAGHDLHFDAPDAFFGALDGWV